MIRDYQREAIDVVKQAWYNDKTPMVVVATGGGKTTIIAQLLKETILFTHRVLVITHTEEIVKQIQSTIEEQCKIPVGVVMGKMDDIKAHIIVATRQSLGAKRLSRMLDYMPFNITVIDEAHHATAENTYGEIVKMLLVKNSKMKLVGFTATPNRNDQKGLFDEIVFSWSILDGVQAGFLVPIRQIIIKTSLESKGLKNGWNKGSIKKIPLNILDTKHWLRFVTRVWEKYILSSNRICLAFFPSVNMSHRFARALNRRGYSAIHIDGNTPRERRNDALLAFRNGEIQILCNMEVLTEGFDAPKTNAILLVRRTQSKILFTQMLGRGLRPANDKQDCLVVNLMDTEKFSLEDILE